MPCCWWKRGEELVLVSSLEGVAMPYFSTMEGESVGIGVDVWRGISSVWGRSSTSSPLSSSESALTTMDSLRTPMASGFSFSWLARVVSVISFSSLGFRRPSMSCLAGASLRGAGVGGT